MTLNHLDLLRKGREHLSRLNVEKVDGMSYFRHQVVGDFKTMFQNIRKAELRYDDVITVGFPRSGNHWAFENINMVLTQSTKFTEVGYSDRILEYLGDYVDKSLAELPSPRMLTSHCRLDRLPEEITKKKVKVVYILRNPKDALVSFYRLMSSKNRPGSCFTGSWDEFFELQMRGELPWGSWFDHMLSTENFRSSNPECPFHVFQYEKAKQEPEQAVADLCHFLGQPVHLSSGIAEATKFGNMKLMAREKFERRLKEDFKEGSEGVMVKGEAGSWRDWFSQEQSDRLDEEFDRRMGDSELGGMVRAYM